MLCDEVLRPEIDLPLHVGTEFTTAIVLLALVPFSEAVRSVCPTATAGSIMTNAGADSSSECTHLRVVDETLQSHTRLTRASCSIRHIAPAVTHSDFRQNQRLFDAPSTIR